MDNNNRNNISSQGNYLLDRGWLPSTRLTFQHFAVTQLQGWVLRPDVEAFIGNLDTPPQIADLATGNGIWAIEIAAKYPNAQVVGIDISDAQFPEELARPSNTSFEVGDLFDPPPQHYHGHFDFVHLRLTCGFIYDKDKEKMMKNILSMIKPGGWIQWEEVAAPPVWTVDKTWTAVTRSLSNNPLKRVFDAGNFLPALEWLRSLADVLRHYGLEQVATHEPVPRPQVLLPQKELILWFVQEVFGLMVKMGKPGAQEEFELVMKEMDEASRSGQMWMYGWMVVVGRKPLTDS